MGLFDRQEREARDNVRPLAARMRPRSLAEFVGQQHFLGEGKMLRRMLEADRLGSVIFYGPPGTGKTSLAELIASHTKSSFLRLNAASAGVKEVRAALDEARKAIETTNKRTVLFIDELHHFNRTQQDVLLPDVEEGIVTLIGATTQNPFFSLVSPLVSRWRDEIDRFHLRGQSAYRRRDLRIDAGVGERPCRRGPCLPRRAR